MDHEKKHYRRDENGIVRYSEDEKGAIANLQQRTAVGKHKDGSVYLRATDADDLAKVKAAADAMGASYRQRRGGASHFGRVGSYEHLHFDHPADAAGVHAALGYHLEENGDTADHDSHLTKLSNGLQHHIQGKDARVDACMVNTRHAHQLSQDAAKADTPDAHRSAAQLHRLSAEAHRAQAARPWTKGEGSHHAGLAILHDTIAKQHDEKAVAAHKRIQAELKRQAELKARMEAMEDGREAKKSLETAGAGTDLSTLEGGGALRAEGHDEELADATMGRDVKKAAPSGSNVRTVYLDMDGVLADYDRAAKERGLDPAKAKDVPGFFRNLEVIEGAKDLVSDLTRRGIGMVVLSTPPEERADEASREKREWLREHFPVLADDAIFTQDKSKHGREDDLLVDDHPEWSNAENFPGTVCKFKGPQDWEHVQQCAIQESGKLKDFVRRTGIGTEISKALNLDPLPEPTPAQIEAGNYQKHHVKVHGLDIAIENPKDSIRRGVDKGGKAWETKMANDYGYLKRSEGADGDAVDVFVGPQPENPYVHVINQIEPTTGKFDETKVMLGFPSREAAIEGYHANYQKGWKGCGDVKTLHVDDFKDWIRNGDTTKRLVIKAATIRLHTASRVEMQRMRMHHELKLSSGFSDALFAARGAGLTNDEVLRTCSNATGAFAPLVNHLKGAK